MILDNVNIVGRNFEKFAIEIKDQKISVIAASENINKNLEQIINFENVICFPGLINSHDHLDFDLFPKLGNKKYQDYVEWGEYIHQKNKEEINSVLKIPVEVRIEFGIIKNILCGVTTVFHHGKNACSYENEIIDIKTGGRMIHSVQLEKEWKSTLINPLNFEKIIIHIGEGINERSKEEINRLLRWNLLNKKLIGIHAVSMNEDQAKKFEALVWCPDSNFFLYDKTAEIKKLKSKTKISFGTDSTLSSDWNIWNHLRSARELNLLNDSELFYSVTRNPAEIFDLKNSGRIEENYFADLIIAKRKSEYIFESFFSVNPEDIILILKKGEVILFDEEIFHKIKLLDLEKKSFYKFNFKGKTKFISYDIDRAIEQLRNYNDKIKIPFLQDLSF